MDALTQDMDNCADALRGRRETLESATDEAEVPFNCRPNRVKYICNDGDGDGDDFQRFTDQFLPVLSLLVQQHHRASQGSFRKHLF